MDVRDFDFDLPPELIAQEPPAERGASRLLLLDRASGRVTLSSVAALPELLTAGDLLVVNNTRVFPARLLGRRTPSGGSVECMLIRRLEDGVWEALMHPGQKLRPGGHVVFDGASHTIAGEILERRFHGRRAIRLWTEDDSPLDEAIDAIGHAPLPPYIKRVDTPDDRDRYQTIFAAERGSVASPTAGLHFTPALRDTLAARGIAVAEITLHVGYGTFQPVRVDQVEDHRVEPERFSVSIEAANAITEALASGRRIIAVGTTTTRTLESVGERNGGQVVAGGGETDLFIYPGFEFRVIRGLMTNFHLPRSSLLMLVSAFAGREHVLQAYRDAVAERYRFYSYGDAMLIL